MRLHILIICCICALLLPGCGEDRPESCVRRIRDAAREADFRALADNLSGRELRTLLRLHGNRVLLRAFYRKFSSGTDPLFLRTVYSSGGSTADCRFLEHTPAGKLSGRERLWRLFKNGKRWKLENILR